MFYKIGKGMWNVPPLRTLLEKVIPEHRTIKGYEVKHDFPFLGLRTMILNAHEIQYENGEKKMLISMKGLYVRLALALARHTFFQSA